MARGRKPRIWVKMDCEGLLRGSINYLLELDGQAVWLKMIAFSEVCGGRPGFIEDNEEHGLPHKYIAQELHCPVELFEGVLKTMIGDKAIKENGTGSIELVNFKHYQFSEYDRQKPYRDAKKDRHEKDRHEMEGETGEETRTLQEIDEETTLISGQSIYKIRMILSGELDATEANKGLFRQELKRLGWLEEIEKDIKDARKRDAPL